MATNIDGSTVALKEAILTAGHIKMKGYEFDVANTQTKQTFTVSVPYDVDALSAMLHCPSAEEGDKVDVIVGKGTTVGLVDNAGGYASGSKVISVDASVLTNTWVGMVVTFGADTNEYTITDRDTNNNTITIWPKDGDDNGLTTGISDDDAVKVSVYMIDSVFIPDADPITVGATKVGGSGIAASTVVTVAFDNASATAKKLYMNVEMLYGDV